MFEWYTGYLRKRQKTICTFPTSVLKLCVLQELFPFKADKSVSFMQSLMKINIYFFCHNQFKILILKQLLSFQFVLRCENNEKHKNDFSRVKIFLSNYENLVKEDYLFLFKPINKCFVFII
jgi:hypothetical protein